MSRKENQTYVTAKGKQVEFVGVSPFEIDEIRQLVEIPEVPTREIQTDVPGYTEIMELTADNLKTDEERRRWAEYEKKRKVAEDERSELVMEFMILEGLRFDMDDMDKWKERRQRWGLPIPDNEKDLRVTYVKTAIIGSIKDVENISQGIVGGMGVDEATLKAVQSTFQRSVQPDAVAEPGDTEGELVV